MLKILLVDDDKTFASGIVELLEAKGHDITWSPSVSEGHLRLKNHFFDLLLLDVMLDDGSGFEVLKNLSDNQKPRHIAIITGHDFIKELIKSAYGRKVSYLIKPIGLDKLNALLARIEQQMTVDEYGIHRHFGFLVGESPPMKKLYTMIDRVASTSANVLIQGECGTGKELVAASIHRQSGVPGSFIATNCGAIPHELIASELFGHEKGAFTGAVQKKQGVFECSAQGTLFLDEITEMPLELQPNLLRVLESKMYQRVGSTKPQEVSSRIISATNRTTVQIGEEQCLREDLYFRLAVFPIELPPLRARVEDIPLLCAAFLSELNIEFETRFQISEADIQRLQNYHWPGNIRELRHLLHRAFIMTDPASMNLQLPDMLESPFAIKSVKLDQDINHCGSQHAEAQPFKSQQSSTVAIEPGQTIESMEMQLIDATLAAVNGNKPQAAEMLGISLKTLYNRLKQYDGAKTATSS